MTDYAEPPDDLAAETLQPPPIPVAFDQVAHKTAIDIDAVLTKDDAPADLLKATLDAHRDVTLNHLLTHRGSATIDITRWRWPQHLFIPGNANPLDHWITSPPDDHRYSRDWIDPADSANHASRFDGTTYTFDGLNPSEPGKSTTSSAGVGVYYTPSMSLGLIELQPQVDCSGTLRTYLEFFPQIAAGYVEVWADLVLAAWQPLPGGGFDLLGFKVIDVATSGRRDQSFGPQMDHFQRSFDGPNLSAQFVVQAGRTYLLGVTGRISVTSTLTKNGGEPLQPIGGADLRAWGDMNCNVPQINVYTKRVDIP